MFEIHRIDSIPIYTSVFHYNVLIKQFVSWKGPKSTTTTVLAGIKRCVQVSMGRIRYLPQHDVSLIIMYRRC